MQSLIPFVCALALGQAPAGSWIWPNDEGGKPATKAWFRKEVHIGSPSTGAIRVACDNHFVAYFNGVKLGEGEFSKAEFFLLKNINERGANVLAIEATNEGGPGGLRVGGQITDQNGPKTPLDTDGSWQVTLAAPANDAWLKAGFDASAWKPATPIEEHPAWKSAGFIASYRDRYKLAPGFTIDRVAEPEVAGCAIAMTWGHDGRLVVARERKGGIVNLIDTNGDGVYDKTTLVTDKIEHAEGLCMVGDVLYVVGQMPEGVGIFKLPDANRDGAADRIEPIRMLTGVRGMGDHSPHQILVGPDGWLYHNSGNFGHWAKVLQAEPESPVRHLIEGDLLEPRMEDANGHAAGTKIPGGTIWRITPDAKKWYLEVAGFRNHYDFAFDVNGEMFTFDSDMEWDIGAPWYKPVRVNHCIPGGDYGWRSGAGNSPPSYFDTLPTTVDIGRGSPTGVIFYHHRLLPEKYRGAFLICDWSMGRILSVAMKPSGATYAGTSEEIISGNPLNVTDIEVDRDGSVLFSTGGRNTEGGVYRLKSEGAPPASWKADSVADVLTIPQIEATWARDAIAAVQVKSGAKWDTELAAAATGGPADQKIRALTLLAQFGPKPNHELLLKCTQDEDPRVRAFATFLLGEHRGPAIAQRLTQLLGDPNAWVRRRACEAFNRSGIEPPVEPLLALMKSDDRFTAYAARIALERVPVQKWQANALAETDPRGILQGLLALQRSAPNAVPATEELATELALLQRTLALPFEVRLDVVRMVQRSLLKGGRGPAADKIAALLLQQLPTGNQDFDMEAARIVAVLNAPGAAQKLLTLMETQPGNDQRLHYALCLRYMSADWSDDVKRRLVTWYDDTNEWKGGHSMAGYIANIVADMLTHYSPADRRAVIESWRDHPFATRVFLGRSDPKDIAGFDELAPKMLDEFMKSKNPVEHDALLTAVIDALGRSSAPQSLAVLRKAFDEHPDLRGYIAKQLARHPSAESWPQLVQSLKVADTATVPQCLAALAKIDRKPAKADDYRTVILTGLSIGDQGIVAANVLKRWTNHDHKKGKDAKAALAYYQDWFRKHYPNEAPAEPPKSDTAKSKYTFEQLRDFLEKNPRARNASAEKGKEVAKKANCLKCHQFLTEGIGVGPDLTSVRRRFQQKEIIESILFPSAVVSDQFKTVMLVTTDGLTYTGLPAPQQGGEKMVLVLSDASRLEIAKDQIEQMAPSPMSVMPEGLLKDLTLEEIADLFAFLETSKNNAAPATNAPAK